MHTRLQKEDEAGFKRIRMLLLVFLLFTCFSSNAQTLTVSGVVTTNGEPLPGVTVLVKGTTIGTITNVYGEYTLENVPNNATLQLSYVGFLTQEIAIGGRTSIDAELVEDAQLLQEVVVVGYGTMERENVTGAITTVDMGEVRKVPLPNVVEGLRGQVAGLRVERGSGQPGSGVSFTIRGYNSLGEGSGGLSQANQPIIVIDGVLMPGGNLNEINPDDIESINVIKDAGAGAIYGSSAANGVILVTTKSGKVGKPTINVNASMGINNLANRLNVMNGDEYIKYLFDSGQGTTVDGILDENELINYVNGESVDWQDELLKTGNVYQVSVGATGGSDKIRYYVNGDMYREEGIVDHSDYNRYSLRINGEYDLSDRIKLGTRVQLTRSDADETSNVIQDFPGGNPGTFAPFIPILENTPLGDIRDENGDYVKYVRDDRFQINPFHRYNESIVDRFVDRVYINPYVEVKIIEGLTYTLNAFYDSRDQFFGRFTSSDYVDGDPSTAQIQMQDNKNYLLDNILNYKRVFGKHGIDATFVFGFQKNEFEQINAFSEQLATDLLGYHAIDITTTTNQRLDWDTDEWGRLYYVGRLGYDYDDRYIVTLTLRRDGSSRFGGENKYGNFPSASVAWNVDNENFWNPDWFIDNLKFRLSYGTLGNDRIGTYSYLALPSVVRSTILVDQDGNPDTTEDVEEVDIVGFSKNTLANPYLKWETSKQFNFGIDFGMFDNRLTGTIDIFNIRTEDLLLNTIIPVINGYTNYISNVGETENKGVEIGLRGTVLETGGFSWEASLNWARNRTKIVKLSQSGPNGEPISDEANGWFIGEDINEIYNYKYIGVWQESETDEALLYGAQPGDAKYLDVNGDNAITPGEDRVFLGNPTPDWYGGLTNTFRYKGIEFSFLFEAVQGITVVNNFYGAYSGRNNQLAINYWTPENGSNEFPRAGSTDWQGTRGDAVKTQDASFFALRNISLSYSLPGTLLSKTPISSLSVFVRGNNLKYFTDYEDAYSPETGRGQYPILRTWRFGTTITF